MGVLPPEQRLDVRQAASQPPAKGPATSGRSRRGASVRVRLVVEPDGGPQHQTSSGPTASSSRSASTGTSRNVQTIPFPTPGPYPDRLRVNHRSHRAQVETVLCGLRHAHGKRPRPQARFARNHSGARKAEARLDVPSWRRPRGVRQG